MAQIKLTDKSKEVFKYLKEMGATIESNVNITAADIAKALGYEKKSSVDGIITGGLQKKGLTIRIPAEIEITNADGEVEQKTVKFIKLTEAGNKFDPDAVVEAD